MRIFSTISNFPASVSDPREKLHVSFAGEGKMAGRMGGKGWVRGEKSCRGGVGRLGWFYYLGLGWWREGGGVGDGGGGEGGGKGRSSVLIRFKGRGMLSQHILSIKPK